MDEKTRNWYVDYYDRYTDGGMVTFAAPGEVEEDEIVEYVDEKIEEEAI